MKEVIQFLKDSGVHYLATVGADGKPKVRPFQFMTEDGGRLCFCTSNKKKVFSEIRARPAVELCAMGPNSSWMRLSGKAVFLADAALKTKVLEASPLVKSIYKTPDNPVFEVFFIADAEAVISDFSGKPPRTKVF